ncbi:MAG: cyclic nucleotide-binding domain-containing protein [Caldilineaceae bacterium]|nr:cyclic nucleotide-binding domain-containing protein [Caldilineaceae bacterium]
MKNDFIQNVPLFVDLPEGHLALLAGAMRKESRAKGTSVYSAGEPSDALLLVESGFVRLIGENGMALATLGPGSLLGEAEFLRGLDHTMSAVAAGDLELLVLRDDGLRNLIKQNPQIGIALSRNFGEHLVQMEDYLVARLADTKILGDMPRNVLRALARSLHPHPVAASAPFFRAGEPPVGLLLLEEGRLEIRPDQSGGEAYPVQAGEIFGVLPLLTNKTYTESAVAAQQSLVWVLPAAEFHQISSHFPVLRRALGRRVRSRLSQSDQTQAVIRLAQTPIFGQMAPENLQAIAQRLVLHHVPAGEPIYRAGEPGDALYLVDAGEAEITAQNPHGIVEELARIATGGFFGEVSLLTGKNRTDDASATRNTNLWALYKADLDELVGLYPAIGTTLNQVVASRLSAQEEAVDESHFRRFPLLANLSSHDLKTVIQSLRPTRFRVGEQIFRAGTPGDMLYLVEQGHVRMQPLSGSNSWVLGEGEILGEKAVLTNQLQGQSAYAETEVDLLTIGREELEALMMRMPTLSMSLSRLLSQRAVEPGATPFSPEQAQAENPYSQAPTLSAQRRRTAAYRPNEGESGKRLAGVGAWFANLSLGAKLRLALLTLILIYLFGVAAPAALGRLLSGAEISEGEASAVSASVTGAVALRSNEGALVSLQSTEGNSQVVLLAAEGVVPTATYTPFPTNTPIPTATPTITPTPTNTPLPTATNTPVPPPPAPVFVQQAAAEPEPQVQAASVPALPARAWDGRLSQLGMNVADASVAPGQPYWRLIEAKWENEQEAGGKHHIYIEVLDEGGNRIVGAPVTIFWSGGSESGATEDKNPPDYAYNYPMYMAGNSYGAKVEGLPSDVMQGMGLGTPDLPFHTIHTNVKLIFQRTIAP